MNNTLQRTKDWFVAAVPEPTNKNINAQTGVHLEEVVEMLQAMRGNSPDMDIYLSRAEHHLSCLASYLKNVGDVTIFTIPNKVKFLDAICDQIVTATGVAHMLNLDIVGAMDEVNKSNFSKFVDGKPIFAEGGKILKGDNYFKPDLTPFIL